MTEVLETGRAFGRYFSDALKTIELEGRKAGLVIALIAGLASAAAVLLSTAWMALMVLLAWALIGQGWSWFVAVPLVSLSNLLVAYALWRYLLRLADSISFDATRRRLLADAEVNLSGGRAESSKAVAPMPASESLEDEDDDRSYRQAG